MREEKRGETIKGGGKEAGNGLSACTGISKTIIITILFTTSFPIPYPPIISLSLSRDILSCLKKKKIYIYIYIHTH